MRTIKILSVFFTVFFTYSATALAATVDDIEGQVNEIRNSVVYDSRRSLIGRNNRTVTGELSELQSQVSSIEDQLKTILFMMRLLTISVIVFVIFTQRSQIRNVLAKVKKR